MLLKLFSCIDKDAETFLSNKRYMKASKEEYIKGIELKGPSNRQGATASNKEVGSIQKVGGICIQRAPSHIKKGSYTT